METGASQAQLSKALEEITRILKDKARMRSLIHYSDLVLQVKSIQLEPYSELLGSLLDQVSISEDSQGRGFLSAVVVRKSGDQKPGPGFFELMEHRGRDISDQTKCWLAELKIVHDYWADKAGP